MLVHKINGYLYIKNNDSFNVSFTVPKKNFTLRSRLDKNDDTVIEVSVTLDKATVSVCAEARKTYMCYHFLKLLASVIILAIQV